MADVTIKYKGSTIAEMNSESTKTLNTSGMYCEDNITIAYKPSSSGTTEEVRYKTYEFTLAKASGWVLLTTLDSDTLAHINDANLVVSLACISGFEAVSYAMDQMIVSNTPVGKTSSYDVYGVSIRQASATQTQASQCFYPPNKTDTSVTLGGGGMFRLSGSNYYCRPSDGYFRAGKFRLTFTW